MTSKQAWKHKRNIEEENDGYVVFKWNIHGTAEKMGGGDRGYSAPPPFQIFKDDVNGFSSISNIHFSITGRIWTSCLKGEWLMLIHYWL